LKNEKDEPSWKLGVSDLRKNPTYVKLFINGFGNVVLGIFPLLLLFLLNIYIYSKLTGRRTTFSNDINSRGCVLYYHFKLVLNDFKLVLNDFKLVLNDFKFVLN
jgi:hypothetical protein